MTTREVIKKKHQYKKTALPTPVAFVMPNFELAPEFKTDDTSEKSILTHPKVYVSINVCKGNVNINGWERDEVCAFDDGGSKVDFKVWERGGDEQVPVWIEVIGTGRN